MELYLNTAEMGDEVWGVEAASQRYFRKPASKLAADQAATLAGLLPFPRSSNPNYRPGRMIWRRNLILRRLRGEAVEVPPVETETVAPRVDIPSPLPDPLAPPDTTPDSVTVPPPDTGTPKP